MGISSMPNVSDPVHSLFFKIKTALLNHEGNLINQQNICKIHCVSDQFIVVILINISQRETMSVSDGMDNLNISLKTYIHIPTEGIVHHF